jgi:carbon-monoxide dehydrogenase small subunit
MEVTLVVNGERRTVDVGPTTTLLGMLREDLGLTGTKEGCGKGACGACTVILDGKPVNSCLVFAVQCDGREVLTVEGLSAEGRLSPIQEAFTETGAVQCGFCTPGMVMSAHALLADNPSRTRTEIEDAISGNLCRCTGYVKIVEAIERASRAAGDPGGRLNPGAAEPR